MGDETKYCLCCGDQVPFNTFKRNERLEVTCVYCGFTLDVQNLWESKKQEPAEKQSAPIESYALVTDDSNYTRKILEDLLRARKFSSHVMTFQNGLELISAYSKLLNEKKIVDIAIIDLNMPVMDGLTAARLMRSVETQGNKNKTPIMFFSAEKADDNLRKQMENLDPANYVNKGSDPDPDKLVARVESLISYLMEKYKQKK
ncbi:MAG: response regulator [Nitrospirota bacterium]|nr:response regulator [Nitrospirota bacterium]